MMFLRAPGAFLFLPGMAAIAVPLLLGAVDPWRNGVFSPGGFLVLAGAVLLLWCVRDFYVIGKGTLAPWDPPKRLVVTGLYRHVRNPMYLSVLLLVVGCALVYRSPLLGLYTLILAIGFHLRVVWYEEPLLATAFGKRWLSYRTAVARWRPRLRPWNSDADRQ